MSENNADERARNSIEERLERKREALAWSVVEPELRELIERWRENPGEVYFNEDANLAVEQCANELESLLERE